MRLGRSLRCVRSALRVSSGAACLSDCLHTRWSHWSAPELLPAACCSPAAKLRLGDHLPCGFHAELDQGVACAANPQAAAARAEGGVGKRGGAARARARAGAGRGRVAMARGGGARARVKKEDEGVGVVSEGGTEGAAVCVCVYVCACVRVCVLQAGGTGKKRTVMWGLSRPCGGCCAGGAAQGHGACLPRA